MTANEYADKVVREFLRNITDHIFLYIQNTENLMREYQTTVNKEGLQHVNATIGKRAKEIFDLENDGVCDKPKSWLIDDFAFHKEKT
jgi:hypothetical protein